MEPIMIFHITLTGSDVSHMETKSGSAVIIPFTGYVESELFSGRVLPGAADVQTVNATGVRHMCAKYMFEGTDSAGKPCKLFVENNGYFERGSTQVPFEATPTFLTDSEVLAPYLHTARFRAEGHGSPVGVDIHIFDVLKEDRSAAPLPQPEQKPAVEAKAPDALEGGEKLPPLPQAAPAGGDKTLLLAAQALCARCEALDADLLERELGIPRADAKRILNELWQNGQIAPDGTVIK